MAESGNHIKPLRLFDIGRETGLPLSDEERTHLRECLECQHIVEVFARQFEKPLRPSQQKKGDAA
jgi:hypothetical protein